MDRYARMAEGDPDLHLAELLPASLPEWLAQMRSMLAEMTSTAEYTVALLRPGLGPVDRGEVRWRLLDALSQAIDLGQVLVMPSLLDVVQARRHRMGDVPLAAGLSWLEVEPGVGQRWCSLTAQKTPPDRPEVVVAPHEIASIETGEIGLR